MVVTASFLPLGIYELWVKLALWKFAAVVGDLLVVSYLVHRITLDYRMKGQASKKDDDDSDGDPPAGLKGGSQASGNRAESTGAVSTKTR